MCGVPTVGRSRVNDVVVITLVIAALGDDANLNACQAALKATTTRRLALCAHLNARARARARVYELRTAAKFKTHKRDGGSCGRRVQKLCPSHMSAMSRFENRNYRASSGVARARRVASRRRHGGARRSVSERAHAADAQLIKCPRARARAALNTSSPLPLRSVKM